MGPVQGVRKTAVCVDPMMEKQTDHIFSPAKFAGHDHPRLVRIDVSTVVQQIVIRLVVVEENHRDTSGADVDDLACWNPRMESARRRKGTRPQGTAHHIVCSIPSPGATVLWWSG